VGAGQPHSEIADRATERRMGSLFSFRHWRAAGF
jgi:hypothetical protein